LIDQPWRMKTQDCPARYADSIARNRAQDKCASGVTWTVDHNALARAAQRGKKVEVITDDTAGTGLNPHLGESRVEPDNKKDGSKQSASRRLPQVHFQFSSAHQNPPKNNAMDESLVPWRELFTVGRNVADIRSNAANNSAPGLRDTRAAAVGKSAMLQRRKGVKTSRCGTAASCAHEAR
jgi:hypothetical protein